MKKLILLLTTLLTLSGLAYLYLKPDPIKVESIIYEEEDIQTLTQTIREELPLDLLILNTLSKIDNVRQNIEKEVNELPKDQLIEKAEEIATVIEDIQSTEEPVEHTEAQEQTQTNKEASVRSVEGNHTAQPSEKTLETESEKPTFVKKEKVLHNEVVPFETIIKHDNNLEIGQAKLAQKGKDGKFTVTGIYKVNSKTGEAELVDEVENLIPAVDEVVVHGAKIPEPKQSQPAPSQPSNDGSTFDILATGVMSESERAISSAKLVEGRDFQITNNLYEGPHGAQNFLYRQDFALYDQYYGVSSTFTNGNIYYAEVMTKVGRNFADLQLGESIIIDGKEYSVKAIEYPFTAVGYGPHDSIPAYTDPKGVYHPAEQTRSLYKHNDYIQSFYYTPTAKMVQVCADPRMLSGAGTGVFTNKIIILDLADGYNFGKGNLYPFPSYNYQPALQGVRF